MTCARLLALLLLLSASAARSPGQEGAAPPEPAPLEQSAAPEEGSSPEEARQLEQASQAEATEIRSEEAKVGQRVRAILAAVEAFAGIRAEVEAGIVVLAGSAPSREAAAQAVATIERLEGVLLVVDDVVVERDLTERSGASWKAVLDQLRGLAAALPLYGAALLIVLAFLLLGRLLRDFHLLYRPWKGRALLQQLLRQTVFFAVSAGGVVLALRFVDAGAVIGTILGAAGVLGIALGFAFRNIVENYLAGILLAIRQPFRARDVVCIDGQEGTVLRMTSSETTLMDADGNHLRLPNAMIFNGKVLNYTRNPLRRFTVAVDVGTEVDLERAQELGVQTLRRMNGVVDDPEPSARIAALGESTVSIELFGWVDQRAASFVKVGSEAHRLVKQAFDEAGVETPPPAYRLAFEAPPPPRPEARAVAPPPPVGPAPDEIDVSPQSDIDAQVADELARSDEQNLLEGP